LLCCFPNAAVIPEEEGLIISPSPILLDAVEFFLKLGSKVFNFCFLFWELR
jgi:hypothetical protein